MGTLEVEGGGLVEFIPEMKVKCHVCGLDVSIGHEGSNEGQPALLHAIPECSAFRDLDVLEYLVQMRKYYQAQGGKWQS